MFITNLKVGIYTKQKNELVVSKFIYESSEKLYNPRTHSHIFLSTRLPNHRGGWVVV